MQSERAASECSVKSGRVCVCVCETLKFFSLCSSAAATGQRGVWATQLKITNRSRSMRQLASSTRFSYTPLHTYKLYTLYISRLGNPKLPNEAFFHALCNTWHCFDTKIKLKHFCNSHNQSLYCLSIRFWNLVTEFLTANFSIFDFLIFGFDSWAPVALWLRAATTHSDDSSEVWSELKQSANYSGEIANPLYPSHSRLSFPFSSPLACCSCECFFIAAQRSTS